MSLCKDLYIGMPSRLRLGKGDSGITFTKEQNLKRIRSVQGSTFLLHLPSPKREIAEIVLPLLAQHTQRTLEKISFP